MTGQPRARSTRARINDEAIRKAAVREITRVGVDHVSLRDVSHRAGLTHGATYGRFESVEELLVDVWRSTLHHHLTSMFELCLSAAQNPSTITLSSLMERLRLADEGDRAAVELLLTSRRVPDLAEECDTFVRNYLEPDNGTTVRSSAVFSRAVFLFGIAMARLFADEQFGFDGDFQNSFGALLMEALRHDPAEIPPWSENCDRLLYDFEAHNRDILPQGHTLRAQLTRSTYSVVGKSGYVRATISRIARRANCSPGGIYKAHHSKEDLTIGAFSDVILDRWVNLSDIAHVLDDDFLSALLRSETDPENERRRNFFLEMLLASGHNDILRTGILRRFREREVLAAQQLDIDEGARLHVRYLMRTVTTLIVATGWLATISDSVRFLDFTQIGEPMRRAMRDWFSDWESIVHELLEAPHDSIVRASQATHLAFGA